MSTNLSSFAFNQMEMLRTEEAVPVQQIRPYTQKNSDVVLGSVFTVVIPKRNFVTLSVKVPDSTAYQQFNPLHEVSVLFKNLVAKPYAMTANGGGISGGFSGLAESAQLVERAEFL